MRCIAAATVREPADHGRACGARCADIRLWPQIGLDIDERRMRAANSEVLRSALSRTLSMHPPLED